MAVCDILDFRCIIINEIVGSAVLVMLLGAILYFIFSSKIKLGFDTTMFLAFPVLLIIGLATASFSAIFAFGTIVAGLLLAIVFNRLLGGR